MTITAPLRALAASLVLVLAVGCSPGVARPSGRQSDTTASATTEPVTALAHRDVPRRASRGVSRTAPPKAREVSRNPCPAPVGWCDPVPVRWRPLLGCIGSYEGPGYDARNPASTASGRYGFLNGTWRRTTRLAPPARAWPAAVQDQAAYRLARDVGLGPWLYPRPGRTGTLCAHLLPGR